MELTDIEQENASLHIALDEAQTEATYWRRMVVDLFDAYHDWTEAVEPIFLQL